MVGFMEYRTVKLRFTVYYSESFLRNGYKNGCKLLEIWAYDGVVIGVF